MAGCIRRMLALSLRGYLQDRRGNFGILTAFLMPVLLFTVGMAVEVSKALEVRTNLQEMADAAALQTATRLGRAREELADDAIPRVANAFFSAQAERAYSDGSVRVEAEPRVIDRGSDYVVEVGYRAQIATWFLRLLGYDDITVTGVAEATVSRPGYADLHILIDNSPSMGIPPTLEDVARLLTVIRTSARALNLQDTAGCEFACHVTSEEEGPSQDYLPVARAAGIPLRIDLVRSGVRGIVDLFQSNHLLKDRFRFNLYSLGRTMSGTLQNPLLQLTQSETEPDRLIRALEEIALMGVEDADLGPALGATRLTDAIDALERRIPPSGDGRDPAHRRQMVLILSDGLQDGPQYRPCSGAVFGPRCLQAVAAAPCRLLKEKGVTVATIHLDYYRLLRGSFFSRYVLPSVIQSGDAMSACASPGFSMKLDFGEHIPTNMVNLFVQMTANPHLTQ